MRTRLLLTALLIALFSALTLSASAQDEEITLRFTQWIPADSPRAATFVAIADEYTAMNPNVTIELRVHPIRRLRYNTPTSAQWLKPAGRWLAA